MSALWWWWSASAPTARARAYRSNRGLGAGACRYQRRKGDHVAATPVPPTPAVVRLRSADRTVPFLVDFARELSAGDSVSSATVTVLAQPLEQEGTVAQTNVTAALLASQATAGSVVTAYLGKSPGAVPGTEYTLRVVATMASGLVLQEDIGGGPESRIYCDE